ncbi:hypothetical protein C8Q80DRAFT_1131207 [Daedaleopsis nitida]|nr:hypothetical protein C8Q80DRAFT_1131207 [Daedaleopsis nitida]
MTYLAPLRTGGEGNINNGDGVPDSGSRNTGSSAGGKMMGSVEKAAGKVTGNAGMVERGQARKLGNQDDTLL